MVEKASEDNLVGMRGRHVRNMEVEVEDITLEDLEEIESASHASEECAPVNIVWIK